MALLGKLLCILCIIQFLMESKEKFVTSFLCLHYQLSTNCKERSKLMNFGEGEGTKEKEKEKEKGKGEGGRRERHHGGGSHTEK